MDKSFGFGVREDGHSWVFWDMQGMDGRHRWGTSPPLHVSGLPYYLSQRRACSRPMRVAATPQRISGDLLSWRRVLGWESLGALEDTADIQVVATPHLGVGSHLSGTFAVLSTSFPLLPQIKLIR